MSAQIIYLQSQPSLDKKHDLIVRSSLENIRRNLNTVSIDSLMPYVLGWITAPEVLTRFPQPDLLMIWDCINDELRFRREEGAA